MIAFAFPIVKVGIEIFKKFFSRLHFASFSGKNKPADITCLRDVFNVFAPCAPFLQMLVPWDPVVPLEQERFDHRGQLHVEVEEVNRECHNKECETSGHQIK